MELLKILAYACIFLFLVNLAGAATIHGTVYDLSLNKANNARVEINTVPKQFVVAQNGTYSFNVPNGAYTIKAEIMQKNRAIASVEENTTVAQDGLYVVDLILFPNVDEGIEDINVDVNSNLSDAGKTISKPFIFLTFAVIFLFIIAAIYFMKNKNLGEKINDSRKPHPNSLLQEDADLEQLIKIIKQEGGRATQKDIRKQIPLSEAKISLMIAELEHKGVVEKIKKGRGNIIILRK